MQIYSLARLAPSRRSRVVLPPIHGSRGAEAEYVRALRQMLRALAEDVRDNVMPLAIAEMTRNTTGLTQDALPGGFWARLIDLSTSLAVAAERLVTRILGLEADRHTEKWKATVRSSLGIDIAAVVRNGDLTEYMEAANERNVGLIQKLAGDTARSVQTAVMDAILQGRTAKQLQGELTNRFGIADRRAKVIARDQVSKLTSDLNRRRHEQAGIATYEWMSSHDERVRSLHKSLNGKEYEYGKPTGAEQGLPPGQPIQCRCVARAIIIIDGQRF